MSYPRSYRGIKDAVRSWAYEKANATSIIRKSGFRPLASDSGIPRPILSIEGSRRVCFSPFTVFAHDENELAIKDGELYFWGLLGTNAAPDAMAQGSLIPKRIPGGPGDLVDVAAAEPANTLLLGEDGTVYYRGFFRTDTPEGPVTLSGAPDSVTQIAHNFSEAPRPSFYMLKDDGTVWHFGEKGAGMSFNDFPPEPWQWRGDDPSVIEQMPTDRVSDIVEIACPYNGLVFRESGGDVGVWYWQSSSLAPDTEFPVYPSGQPSGVVKIVGQGEGGPVVLTEDGEIWASGNNSFGQYGNGTTSGTSYASWHKADGSGYTDVATASASILAVKDGTLWTWGHGGVRSARGASAPDATTPQDTGFEANMVFGNYIVKAPMLQKEDGCVMIWGENGIFGWLGRGYTGGVEESPQILEFSEAYPSWPVL